MDVFKKFEQDDIVKANPAEVSTGLWTGDTGSLALFHISAAQSASAGGQYYYDVYNDNVITSSAEVQFAVAYGNIHGHGAETLTENDNALLPTKSTYFQYRNILLEPDDTNFSFLPASGSGTYDSDDIYVINIKRSRLKEKLDPGNWSLILSSSTTQSTFIDDSGQTLGETFGTSGRVFNVVKGTLTGDSGSTVHASSSISGGYGLVYPDVGIIVLNPNALTAEGLVTAVEVGTDLDYNNKYKLLESIMSGSDFQARSAEVISSTHYFVRMRNKEFNYSNNPSFFNEANGAILNTNFVQDPKVFATTVGLYNDNNELLAIAKVSQPLMKSFDREALVRVRLDF